jgi:hypothetical protein
MDSSQVLLDVPLREDWIRLVASDKERMLEEYAAGWQLAPTLVSVLEEKVAHTEVQALRLGDTTLVAFPGEVFVETSQKLKQQFAAQKLAVIELANDNIGYIPTRKAFDEGGYECGLHFGARIPPEGEARLYEAAGRAIETIILTDKGVDA